MAPPEADSLSPPAHELITGRPLAIASTGGIPKPSYVDGWTSTCDPL